MTVLADGTAKCDACGKALENGGVQECVQVHALLADGTPRSFHVCADDSAAVTDLLGEVSDLKFWYHRLQPEA